MPLLICRPLKASSQQTKQFRVLGFGALGGFEESVSCFEFRAEGFLRGLVARSRGSGLNMYRVYMAPKYHGTQALNPKRYLPNIWCPFLTRGNVRLHVCLQMARILVRTVQLCTYCRGKII